MIIGISGKKQHGKDTLVTIIQWLIEYPNAIDKTDDKNRSLNSFVMDIGMGYKPKWEQKMFAEKLKQIVCLLIGCTMEQLEDQTFKEKLLGEEWRVWYGSYYKLKYDKNPKGAITPIFYTEEEVKEYIVSAEWLAPFLREDTKY